MANSQSTLRANAALAGSENLPDQDSPYARGVIINVVTTNKASSASLVAKIQGKTKLGTYFDLPGAATAAITSNTVTTLVLRPGVAATANSSVPGGLPRQWRVVLTLSGGTYDCSVTADLLT
ncbi:MAG TPA: hypothetical protein VMU51_34245 [Mycobacteriales bacterium]|nr:hypothetical protein [Mycobacteriales bacterium]